MLLFFVKKHIQNGIRETFLSILPSNGRRENGHCPEPPAVARRSRSVRLYGPAVL